MKIKNSTDWPNHFLRRLVSWCCKQLDHPASKVRLAQFTRYSGAYRGRAWSSRRILCRVGSADRFPMAPDNRPGMAGEVFADQTEALVAVTAHELAHLAQYREGRIGGLKQMRVTEPATRREEVRVLRAFRANREVLLAEWSAAPPKPEKPKASLQDKRAAKAQADLGRWQRKLKLAQTKVRKLKTRVKYYEHAIAAKRS